MVELVAGEGGWRIGLGLFMVRCGYLLGFWFGALRGRLKGDVGEIVQAKFFSSLITFCTATEKGECIVSCKARIARLDNLFPARTAGPSAEKTIHRLEPVSERRT